MYSAGKFSHLSEHSWHRCLVPAVRSLQDAKSNCVIIIVVRITMLSQGTLAFLVKNYS